ncbi:MAG: hypothetical protein WDM96_03565 [Lacunisphaera sp.]
MKTLAYLAGFSLVLVMAGLGSGCASSTSTSYRQPARDFEVVETSAPHPLTDKEMTEVRASVASFLDREGATDSGDYFLKVYLTPASADAEPDWVVVRFTRYTAERVVLASDYDADSLYSPYYSYDLYPYGYGGVTRIAFQYYVDPFYGRHYAYYPRHNPRGRPGDHDHDHDHANNHGPGGQPGKPPGNGDGVRPPPKLLRQPSRCSAQSTGARARVTPRRRMAGTTVLRSRGVVVRAVGRVPPTPPIPATSRCRRGRFRRLPESRTVVRPMPLHPASVRVSRRARHAPRWARLRLGP